MSALALQRKKIGFSEKAKHNYINYISKNTALNLQIELRIKNKYMQKYIEISYREQAMFLFYQHTSWHYWEIQIQLTNYQSRINVCIPLNNNMLLWKKKIGTIYHKVKKWKCMSSQFSGTSPSWSSIELCYSGNWQHIQRLWHPTFLRDVLKLHGKALSHSFSIVDILIEVDFTQRSFHSLQR